MVSGKLKPSMTVSTIKKGDGTFTADLEETLEDDTSQDEEVHRKLREEVKLLPKSGNDARFSREEVRHTISTLNYKKAPANNSFLIERTKQNISSLEARGILVHVFKVRAHSGIDGNEMADINAKSAALDHHLPVVYNKFPLLT
uniref:RNase H type-1 domain-containing protein n=1 Tax=Rhodnius prolixus TaxID=13249 RepID=T1HH55_RHOPR